MKLCSLVAAACLVVSCLSSHAHEAPPPSSITELPFELVHGAVIAQVSLNGHGPFAMMLDTGADPSVIDRGTARAAGLKLSAEGAQGSGGGTDVNLAYATRIGSLGLGALQARGVDAVAMDLTGVGKALGMPLRGVLGRSLLKGRVVQIDYPKRVVRFFGGSARLACERATDTPQRTTLAYRYRDDILLSGVKVDGKPAVANLDTGASSAFQIAPAAVASLGLSDDLAAARVSQSTGFNGAAANRTGHVEKIDVGSIAVDHPEVVFDGQGTGRDDVGWSIRIGSGFLQDYVVTLDDRRHRVCLEKH